jgi:TatD DNase family protein
VTIHTRDADQDTLALLHSENAKDLGGVIHCFSHSYEFGKAALDLGFYLSIPGVITFKKSEALRAVVKRLPLDRMMIETDSPYLAPVPMRGKPNEPSFVAHTAKFLAELKGVSLEEVAEKTTTNACALYRVTCD